MEGPDGPLRGEERAWSLVAITDLCGKALETDTTVALPRPGTAPGRSLLLQPYILVWAARLSRAPGASPNLFPSIL